MTPYRGPDPILDGWAVALPPVPAGYARLVAAIKKVDPKNAVHDITVRYGMSGGRPMRVCRTCTIPVVRCGRGWRHR